VSVGTWPGGEPPSDGGVPLSDGDWEILASLQAQLDLGSPVRRAPEAEPYRAVAFMHRVAVWLRWLLDPKAEGLPMPPLRDPRRRRPVRPGRAGAA
jgi:hypothetical protein